MRPLRAPILLAPILLALAVTVQPAQALTLTDTLEAWRESTAMDRMQLATKFGKSFISLNEGFTAEFFLKCIDDVSTYGKASTAKIDDAVRECVASRLRKPDDDE